MKIAAARQGAQAIMSCKQVGTATVTVTVFDFVLGTGAAGADVSLTVATESATAKANGSGVVQFDVTEMDETTSLSGMVKTSYGTPSVEKATQVAVTPGNVPPIYIYYGVPNISLLVTKLPDVKSEIVPHDTDRDDEAEPPEELRKAYDFLSSYTGPSNTYDSFKKVDHKFRNDPDGPVAEVPAVLACTDTGERDPVELDQLSVAFSTVAAKLAGGSTARHKVTVLIKPEWVAGEVVISLETAGTVEVLDGSETGKLTVPHRAAFGPGKPAELIVSNGEPCAITLRAKLLSAEHIELDVAPPEVSTKIPLPVNESWVSFKKQQCTYKEFAKASGPVAQDVIKLARVAALYWYSDTGDVLMNAYLRDGDLEKKLAERVDYLKLYYKDKVPDCQKLPTAEQIKTDIETYRKQLKAQADMLEDALASDLLRIPAHDTKLYRGITFESGTDVASKFVLGKPSELKGFSSSATDVDVAYRFMKDNASDMNVITLAKPTSGFMIDPEFETLRKERLKALELASEKQADIVKDREKDLKELKKGLDEARRLLQSAKLGKTQQNESEPQDSSKSDEDDPVETLTDQVINLAASVRAKDLNIKTLQEGLERLQERIDSVRAAKPPVALPNDKAAIPVLYRIMEGADRGRSLGKYSMHSGESEVLFGNGVHPTPISKGMIKIEDGKATLDDASGDGGFKRAQSELAKDITTSELRKDMERYKKYQDAVSKDGASLGLEWPHGEGIVLVSAKMG